MIFGHERKMQALKDLENIRNALCALDMDGAFRASYIMKQVEDLEWILDRKGKGKKRYAHYKARLRGEDSH